MGLRLRKSINLGGGFRVNFSKSGVGYSWGVPGYRITKTASGRKRRTYSIPGTGISYVNESKTPSSPRNRRPITNPISSVQNEHLQDIDSAQIEELQPAEYQELLSKLSKILVANRISNILLLFVFLLFQPLFLIIVAIGLAMKVVIHIYGKIELHYDLDEFRFSEYKNRIETWNFLNENKKLWQVIQAAAVTNKKVNAGASRNINRRIIKFLIKKPFYLKANVDTLQVKLRKETLIFLPDKILLIRGIKAGAIEYETISHRVSSVRFIESGIVPSDAQIVDYTWQYVNKSGTPDKRFKNNRKLPVCLYGQIFITSPSGLNIELQCSSNEKAKMFEERINNDR
jgi:hypothetical protein